MLAISLSTVDCAPCEFGSLGYDPRQPCPTTHGDRHETHELVVGHASEDDWVLDGVDPVYCFSRSDGPHESRCSLDLYSEP